jgi:hypothetical protein
LLAGLLFPAQPGSPSHSRKAPSIPIELLKPRVLELDGPPPNDSFCPVSCATHFLARILMPCKSNGNTDWFIPIHQVMRPVIIAPGTGVLFGANVGVKVGVGVNVDIGVGVGAGPKIRPDAHLAMSRLTAHKQIKAPLFAFMSFLCCHRHTRQSFMGLQNLTIKQVPTTPIQLPPALRIDSLQ